MLEDNDQEITELDIQSKSYDKLKKKMKKLGFKEGVAKGRDKLLQKGFDLGYSEGFRVGYQIGLAQGFIRYNREQNSINNDKLSSSYHKERELENLRNQSCDLCQKDQKYDLINENDTMLNSFEHVVKTQKKQADIIVEAVQDIILSEKT